MAIVPIKHYRVESDHAALLEEAASSLTIGAVRTVLNSMFPFVDVLLRPSGNGRDEKLRVGDKIQAKWINPEAKQAWIEQVRLLSKLFCACDPRKPLVYASTNYDCRSFGGYWSFTAPIISIPRNMLGKPMENRLDSPSIALKREVTLIDGISYVTNRNAQAIESTKLSNPEINTSITDESLFFIAREVVNIYSNNNFKRLILKVALISAVFFIHTLSLPTIASAAAFTTISAFNFIGERFLRNSLDIEAVNLLEKKFIQDNKHDKRAQQRAYEVGERAIDKLIKHNIERREENGLCRLYVLKSGDNLLDLLTPFLTVRKNRLLEDFHKRSGKPLHDGRDLIAQAPLIPVSIAVSSNSQEISTDANLKEDKKSFDEIREKGANFRSNRPFMRIILKVVLVSALFFIYALSLSAFTGTAIAATTISFYFMRERSLRNPLDIEAVKLLEKKFIRDGELDVKRSQQRAYEAGKRAIEESIKVNIERRSKNDFRKLYLTENGDNLLDLFTPFLTARLNRLELFHKKAKTPLPGVPAHEAIALRRPL
jgi:hypothetical protein